MAFCSSLDQYIFSTKCLGCKYRLYAPLDADNSNGSLRLEVKALVSQQEQLVRIQSDYIANLHNQDVYQKLIEFIPCTNPHI